jgi:hypothetical protein
MPSIPASVRTARAVLWCLLVVNGVGTTWRLFQLLTSVRPDARFEFFYVLVLYPVVLTLADATALVLLRRGSPWGPRLAILIFLHFGLEIAWLPLSGGGPGIETAGERFFAILVQGGLAIALISLAVWLFFRGGTMDRRRNGGQPSASIYEGP